MRRFLIFTVILTGCANAETKPDKGETDACAAAPESLFEDSDYDATDLVVSGTVTEVLTDVPQADFNVGHCSPDVLDHALRLDVDGDEVLVGFNVRDADGQDMLPADLFAEGEELDVLFRSLMMWGTVEAVTLRDADGLRLVVEQGSWGGALEEAEVDDLVVRNGEKVAKDSDIECGHWNGYAIDFTAPDQPTVTLTPVEAGPLTLSGLEMTAVASAAVQHQDGPDCSISDIGGRLGWALYR
jgi:hypothetical protein